MLDLQNSNKAETHMAIVKVIDLVDSDFYN